VVIELDIGGSPNANTAVVTIPRTDFNKAADRTNADLKIHSGMGSVTFDAAAVASIRNSGNAGNISIGIIKVNNATLNPDIRALVEDRPVFEFSVKAGSAEISTFGGGNASISLPYTLQPGEDPNSIVVYYIDNTGKLITVMGIYNISTRTVDFVVQHFSKYLIGYTEINFSDVPSTAWYKNAISFLSAKDIIRGALNSAGKLCIAPTVNVTRADFLIMVMKSYGIPVDSVITDNFADAYGKNSTKNSYTYYTVYLGTAKRLGLVSGVGGNMFAPEATISRQDMFVILYNVLSKIGKLPADSGTGAGKILGGFSDASGISAYARTAMNLFVQTGIAAGSGNKLAPIATCTRAEAMQVLYNLLTK